MDTTQATTAERERQQDDNPPAPSEPATSDTSTLSNSEQSHWESDRLSTGL